MLQMIMLFFSGVSAFGLSLFLPRALAEASPAMVLSQILSRSCSASNAKIPKTNESMIFMNTSPNE